MDATYVDPSIWSRLSSSFQYLKTLIKDNPLFSNQTLSFSPSASSNPVASKRMFFPGIETSAASLPPPQTDLAQSSLREFATAHQKQIISVLSKLLGVSISAITTYFLLKWLMRSLDPTNTDKLAAKSRAEAIMKQLGVSLVTVFLNHFKKLKFESVTQVDPKTQELNEYEMVIASNIILPSQIDCSWEDIGGLDHLADELRETVIYPLSDFSMDRNTGNNQTRRSRLVQPPKGVLLFGPPGNAKTMIGNFTDLLDYK